jgi:trehalose 6-phosphate synthase
VSTPTEASQAPTARVSGKLADVVIVANRLPVDSRTSPSGETSWVRSPGGLVTALESVVQDQESMWIGWSGRPSDDEEDAPSVPESVGWTGLREVPLTAAEVIDYYEGFCNAAIWPLYHDAVVPPVYHREAYESYRVVNRRFADVVASQAARNATVWVHDYQLQLVPKMLREMRPDLRIGFFLHIPFPPVELFMQLPWRRQIVEGLLGADLVGFQLPGAARNFVALAQRLTSAHMDQEDPDTLWVHDTPSRQRAVSTGAFPISIDFASLDRLARDPSTEARAREIREELGNPKKLLLGVDRLDYTKGIDIRLNAIVELMEERVIDPDETVFFQIATPSRQNVEEYQRIRESIESTVGRAVADLGRIGYSPVQYLHTSLPMTELAAFYRAADVMLVTPLRDGMNLVAKEYVASRIDEDGALVLSEFTGAAEELTDAWLVNPHDPEAVKQAILRAIRAPAGERQRRMRSMRDQVAEFDVHRWADDFLSALHRDDPTRQRVIRLDGRS